MRDSDSQFDKIALENYDWIMEELKVLFNIQKQNYSLKITEKYVSMNFKDIWS